jgi:type IV pilus assembly protein PilQ
MVMRKVDKSGILLITLLLLLFAPLRAESSDIRTRIDRDKRLFSIEVRDAEVSDVLRALAQQSGFNIILGEGVKGKVTLSFTDIGFKDALEIIIKSRNLRYTIQNNVFWVGADVDTTADIAMEVLRLNYADPASAAEQLKGSLSKEGTATPDERTNAVILRDMPANIARARRLLTKIDIQTAQVEIEARIVEASTNFTRQLGVQWGGEYTQGSDALRGSALLPVSAGGRNFAVNLPATAASSGLGIIIGNITSKLILDLELSAAETRGDLRIVSSPKISTLNNKPATIHSGLTFRVKLTQTQTTGTTTVSTDVLSGLEEIKTGIDLTVTPKISNDDYILLEINTNKSDPDFTHVVDGIPGVTEKSADTHVLVKNGDTVVIGGLYKTSTTDQNDSVPFLSRIPLLGFLFKSSSKTRQDEELLVFITPNIVKRTAAKEGSD